MINKIIFNSTLAVCFVFNTQYVQCAEKGKEDTTKRWEQMLTDADKEKAKSIFNCNDEMESRKKFVQEFPEATRALVEENKKILSSDESFESYCKGIPADKDLSLEETLYLEKRRLLTEVYQLEKCLNQLKQ